ncbi:MAG: hypothetical protein ACO4AJ_00840 [Prochlorothrix sp.]
MDPWFFISDRSPLPHSTGETGDLDNYQCKNLVVRSLHAVFPLTYHAN